MYLLRTVLLSLLSIAIVLFTTRIAVSQPESRDNTAVFDIPNSIPDPINFNWFTRGTKREQGAHQTMWEPLFILNDRTGVLEPWLGLEILPDDAQKVWTLKLRDKVFWSD